jgi:lysophospholipase L1-like esterase/fibronectin type 3 domain-containing protein
LFEKGLENAYGQHGAPHHGRRGQRKDREGVRMKKRTIWAAAAVIIAAMLMFLTTASAAGTPGSVEELTFSKPGARNIQLSWPTVSGAEGYVLYRRPSGVGGYTRITKGSYNGVYDVGGLEPNTTYDFVIRSYNTVNGKEALSPSFPIVTATTMAPAVTGLKAQVLDGEASMSWNASGGADGYYVFYNAGSGWHTLGGTTETTYTAPAPADAKQISYGVKTYKYIDGYRYISRDLASVKTTAVTTPGTVEDFAMEYAGASFIRLKWSKLENVEGYVVYQYVPATNKYQRLAKGNFDNYTVENLKANTGYRFTIRAYNTLNGKDLLSPEFPVIDVGTMPAAVKNLKASASGDSVKLTWTASAGADGYYVFYNTGKGWKTYGSTTSASFSAELPEYVSKYSFGVKAYQYIGGYRYISRDLSTVKLTVTLTPPTVTGLKLKSVGANSAQIIWDEQKGVEGYVVYQKVYGASGGYKRIGKKNYNGVFTATGLSPDTTYQYAVRAYRTVDGKESLSAKYPQITVTTCVPHVKNLTVSLSEERSYFTWSASKGAAGYYIYYNSGGGWVFYGSTTKTAFRKKELTPATEYTFAVKTYQIRDGATVASRDYATVKGCTAPSMPSYSYTRSGDTYTLKWNAVARADEYIVYSQLPGESWVRRGVTTNKEFSFTQKNAQTLYLAVRAVKKYGSEKITGDYWKKRVTRNISSGTVFCFGDSIAKGTGSHRFAFADIFGEEHNLTVYTRTVSGGSLCSALDAHHICQDVIDYIKPDSNYNYIMLEGVVNDYYYNCAPGKVTPAGTTDFDMNTVSGALEAAFSHIAKNSPKSKVIYVMMHDAAHQSAIENALGLTLTDYRDAIKAVCEKYGVEMADCLNTGLRTDIQSISKQYTYHYFGVFPNGDGVHPSEEAYRLFYLPAIEAAAKRAKAIGDFVPAEPTEPTDATESTEPTEPTVPDETTEPTVPDEPTEPGGEATPDEGVPVLTQGRKR